MMFPANIWIKSSRAGYNSYSSTVPISDAIDNLAAILRRGRSFPLATPGSFASTTAAAAPPAFGPIALLHTIRLARGVARDDWGHCGARLG